MISINSVDLENMKYFQVGMELSFFISLAKIRPVADLCVGVSGEI